MIGTGLPPFQEESDLENGEDNHSDQTQFPKLPWCASPSTFTWKEGYKEMAVLEA